MSAPGWIWCENREIVGVAADGIEVSLGAVDFRVSSHWLPFSTGTLAYLAANPTPDRW